MRRFVACITFLGFLIISQLQLVHAVDMKKTTSIHSREHIEEVATSLFCETSPDNNQSECVKELIPHKALFERDTDEHIEKTIYVLPFYFSSEILSGDRLFALYHQTKPPNQILQKTAYQELIGIIKSLT